MPIPYTKKLSVAHTGLQCGGKAIKENTTLVDIKHVFSVFNTSINHRKDEFPSSAGPTSTYNWLPLSFKDPRRNRSNVSASSFSSLVFSFLKKNYTLWLGGEREAV